MSATYKKGEIVWAKIQGYSWWPGRITKIKLKLCIRKNRLGKYILKYENEPYFYITFFPNDSISKVKLKSMKKFIDGYKLRNGITKRKKLNKAIYIATKTFLKENPNLDIDIKRNIFNIKLFSRKKFTLLRRFRALGEEEEEMNGENDIQSFIDSEMNECENYKNELKENNSKKKYIGKKRKKSYNDENSEVIYSENEESSDNIDNINKRCNKELKKYSNELYKINIEIKRKNTINNIINLFNKVESLINKHNIEYSFNVMKDLFLIVNNYTNHNNEIIMNKSKSLHKDLIFKYLNNFFRYDKNFLEKDLLLFNESFLRNKDKNINNNYLIKIEQLGYEIGLQLDNLNNNNNNDNQTLKNEEIVYNKKQNYNYLKIKDKELYKQNEKNSKEKEIKEEEINNKKYDKYYNNINNIEIKNIYNFNFNPELNDTITISINDDNNKKSNDKNDNINDENLDKSEPEDNIDITIDDKNDNKILSFNNNEPFLKDIINNPNYFSKKPEGRLYPDNFFEEIYLKSGITSKSELLRKKMCLQLYNILKLVLPFCQEDIFKKNVIFLEYLARHIDPLFGNKYMIIINMIYNRIKSEAVKLKNKNKK